MPVCRFRSLLLMRCFLAALMLLALNGCGSGDGQPARTAKFAVISDPHLYDAETLGAGGADLDAYRKTDRKLFIESREIASTAFNALKSDPLDFVLITGDLTKDGERVSHQVMAAMLADVKASGKKVFVIPGNHDINNPVAVSYKTSPPTPVATISPAEFKQIYADFGYNEAIAHDADSLSYVAEPVPGVWLFAIDSCRYDNNFSRPDPDTGGELRASTQSWIIERLTEAQKRGKTVIGMMHHGMTEHLAGQTILYPDYVLKDWLDVGQKFSDHGLNLIFTGHFHSHDVTMQSFSSSVLYDVETASLVSYPTSYRVVDLDISGKTVTMKNARISGIPSRPTDFEAFARNDFVVGVTDLTNNLLSAPPYSLATPMLSSVTPLIVSALLAHFTGDEKPDFFAMLTFNAMLGSTDPATRDLGRILSSLWTDLPPQDGNGTITIGLR